MKEKITETAKKQKISDVGFCDVTTYLKASKGLPREASFCEKKDEKTVLAGAKTIVVCAFSYYCGDEEGNVSRYARGYDYHRVAIEKMSHITAELEQNGYFAEAFADSGPLDERLLARLSGIAFIGRNRMAINSEAGSYFFIGYVVTDCEIEADEENKSECAGCRACVKACPLGALDGDGFCEEKCLSYITQKKGELSEREKDAIRRNGILWGCDICQEVCPHNRNIPLTEIREFKENLITELYLDENISNSEFKKKYRDRAFAWRGKNVLLRNQKILYNKEEKDEF